MNPFKTFIATLGSNNTKTKLEVNSVYDIEINSLQGKLIDLSKFKGKHILFVNVATKCGFTPQYKKLQQLHEEYGDKLQVIGLPCNQFGGQEPGDTNDIENFCQVNYGVSFLITEKLHVKGKQQHPLYSWLTQKINNGVKDSSVKWNFQKYLVDREGLLVDYYFSATSPMSSKILKYLK
ncbi:glutathione peroxidase [Hyunsoonleella sp. 2307UL5-6]|uniref:glutathione peroxidase n=1 Tax=Hyunsoonleella sp. 2307UL5-6 TaxID=3384768 RepID=UPI0039BC874A